MTNLSTQVQKSKSRKPYHLTSKFKKNKAKTADYVNWLFTSTPREENKTSLLNTLKCGTPEFHNGKKIIYYCKNRWCINCNRIKMAKFINKYHEKLSKIDDLQFVTLTAKTVPYIRLSKRISEINTIWRKIKKVATNRGYDFTGIRKLEINHSVNKQGYPRFHVHIHILINGIENAQYIKEQWILKMTKLYDKKEAIPINQKIIKADSDTIKELAKYMTKPSKTLEEDSNGNRIYQNKENKRFLVHGYNEYKIHKAMKHQRIIQTFGRMFNIKSSNLKKL